jgi:spermidine synthase
VPSFGEWGFIVAARRPFSSRIKPDSLPAGLQFLNPANVPTLFDFPLDMARVPAQVNRLSNQALVTMFEQEWGKVGH